MKIIRYTYKVDCFWLFLFSHLVCPHNIHTYIKSKNVSVIQCIYLYIPNIMFGFDICVCKSGKIYITSVNGKITLTTENFNNHTQTHRNNAYFHFPTACHRLQTPIQLKWPIHTSPAQIHISMLSLSLLNGFPSFSNGKITNVYGHTKIFKSTIYVQQITNQVKMVQWRVEVMITVNKLYYFRIILHGSCQNVVCLFQIQWTTSFIVDKIYRSVVCHRWGQSMCECNAKSEMNFVYCFYVLSMSGRRKLSEIPRIEQWLTDFILDFFFISAFTENQTPINSKRKRRL